MVCFSLIFYINKKIHFSNISEEEDISELNTVWNESKKGYRKLHIGSPTRWLCVFKFCDSFLELHGNLNCVSIKISIHFSNFITDSILDILMLLDKEDLMLSKDEVAIITDIRDITGCFSKAQVYLQAKNYPTLNRAALFITEIKQT